MTDRRPDPSGEAPSGLDRFFSEIRRRGLLNAAGAYAVLCWFLVQLFATVAGYMELEDVYLRSGLGKSNALLRWEGR